MVGEINKEDVYSNFKVAHHKKKLNQLKKGKPITPVFVQWDLTNRCNLSCNFCFYRIYRLSDFDPNQDMSRETVFRLLNELNEMGVKAIEWSVRGDEIIPIEFNGNIKIMKIKDFVNNYEKYKNAKSWSLNEKRIKDNIVSVFKHKCPEDLVKITLKTGKNITTTQSHSIFFYENEKIIKKRVNECKIGDLVVISKSKLIENPKDSIEIKMSNFDNRFGSRPKNIIIDKDFCRMLGYFTSEGSYDYCRGIDHGITFTFGNYEKERKYIDDLIYILQKLEISPVLKKYRNKTRIRISKKWFAELLKHIDCGEHSTEKRVPDILFNLNNECKLEYLKGLFAGDGCYRNTISRNCNRNSLNLKTSSKLLQQTTSLLLDNMEVFSHVGEGLNKKRYIGKRELPITKYYTVSVYSKEELEKLKEIIKFIGGQLIYKKSNFSHPTKHTKIIEINEDAYALPIEKIEIIPNTEEIVYDISVGNTHRFESSFRILCHNTGGGEPTLHPNFEEIVLRAKELGFEQALVTNGTLLNNRTINLIKDFSWVRFSVDSATPDTYLKIKGVYFFNKVIDNMKKLLKVKNENNIIGFSFIVCPDNYREILKATLLAKDIGCDNIRFSLAMTPSREKLFENIWDECTGEIQLAKEEETEDFKVFAFSNRINELSLQVLSDYCGYHHFVGVIAPAGIYPCCRLKDDGRFNFGNPESHTFKQVWFGQKRKNFIKKIDRNGCPYDCWMSMKNQFIAYLMNDNPPHVNFL